MRKNYHGRTSNFKYAAIALVIVFLISSALLVIMLWERGQGDLIIDPEESLLDYGGKKYELNKDIETFLVMGLDKTERNTDTTAYYNDMCADFLMLFIIDEKAKTCSAISINRDTMANVNRLGVAGNKIDTVEMQICLAHSYGNGREVSCRNTADAVSWLLCGIEVDHFMSVTMNAVSVFNDLVGGVEVEVLEDIDETLVKGQTVTLTGEQAFKYVRGRQTVADGTSINRMKRQRQYMNALREKTMSLIESDEQFIIEATVTMADYIVSNRTITHLQDLLKKVSSYEFTEIYDIEGESKVGEKYMEFRPAQRPLEKMVIDLFYNEVFE